MVSGVTSEDVQKILALLDGVAVEAHVYSGTNKCFNVTEKMLRDAWSNLDKDKYYWINESHVERLVERFTVKNDYGNTLACTLPNSHCESTPAEIEKMLETA